MVSIVLASHGKFAEGIMESGQMIFGPQKDVAAVTLSPQGEAEGCRRIVR
mgnify:CR=1 FL=1